MFRTLSGFLLYCVPTIIEANAPAVAPDYYACTCHLPQTTTGYYVARKEYLDELDPALLYPEAVELKTFATPGEYEPVTFVIYATKDLKNVRVEAADLKLDNSVIPQERIEIRTVARAPRRNTYKSPPEENRVVSRFLFPTTPFDLPAGHFREIWVTIHVPGDAGPGCYESRINIKPGNAEAREIPLKLEVLPFKLRQTSKKRYGVYHEVKPDAPDLDRSKRELVDIHEHGGTLIYPHLHIEYSKAESGDIDISYDRIRKGLPLLRDAGFQGPVPIGTGFNVLQRLLKLKHEQLETSTLFLSTARRAIEGMKQVQKEFPNLEIALTHLDEVFNRNRVPRYIAMTKAAQQVPGFRFYVTFHTVSDEADHLREELDAYVDIRGHHGYSFEWWLARGHTFDEYETELERTGDVAWLYLNPNRIWRDAKYQRLMNGLYMWLSPFSGRLDWGYSKPVGDPFNDLDGSSTDTGYAFWSPSDPEELVPTRDWEAWREGIDDVKYLMMLQALIEENKGADAAKAAAQWLAALRERMPKPQGLTYTTGPTQERDASESPFILALRKTFSSADLQHIRYEAAKHIATLLQAEGQ